jgi:uncharacterized repeat protein (TIGR04138 family)
MNERRLLTWVTETDNRYHPNAYHFVLEALRFTQCHFKKPRHITGRELLAGIARFAKQRFGEMAILVFNEWGIQASRDFGNIVFNLVELGEVKKTAEDRIEDFDDGFDLETELSRAEMLG